MRLPIAAIAFAAAFGLAAPAAASTVLISPVAAKASSTFSADYDIGNTIDQSGLSQGFTSGVTHFDDYFALKPKHSFEAEDNEWFTLEGVRKATVVFDLGAIFHVTRFALWNEDNSGFKKAKVSYSVDNDKFISLGELSGTNWKNATDYPADIFKLSFTGRYFRMELTKCPMHGSTFDGCAIGEVAFGVAKKPDDNGIGVIPLPASLPLLAGGFGLLGALGARRRLRKV